MTDVRTSAELSDADGLNVTEAAAYLHLHRSTVSRLVAAGAIPHRRVGRVPRFSRQTLTHWLSGRDEAPTAAPTTPRPRLAPKHVGRRLAPPPASRNAPVFLGGAR